MPYRQPLLVAQNERREVRRAQLMRREEFPARNRARAVVSAGVQARALRAVVSAHRRRRERRGRVLLVEAADAQERLWPLPDADLAEHGVLIHEGHARCSTRRLAD